MKPRSLILIVAIGILALNSCDKPPTATPVDISYLDGLEGNYSIECEIAYTDTFGVYQFIDTTYIGVLTSNTEDIMLLEFIQGSLVEMEFTYNHQVRARCSNSEYTYYIGNWMIEDNVPSFEFNQTSSPCIEGFSGSSITMTLIATKF